MIMIIIEETPGLARFTMYLFKDSENLHKSIQLINKYVLKNLKIECF